MYKPAAYYKSEACEAHIRLDLVSRSIGASRSVVRQVARQLPRHLLTQRPERHSHATIAQHLTPPRLRSYRSALLITTSNDNQQTSRTVKFRLRNLSVAQSHPNSEILT